MYIIPGFSDKFQKEINFPALLSFDNISKEEQKGIKFVPGRDQIYEQVEREKTLTTKFTKTDRKIKKHTTTGTKTTTERETKTKTKRRTD